MFLWKTYEIILPLSSNTYLTCSTELVCLLQKKKKPEKKATSATYDIPTPKGQKKGELAGSQENLQNDMTSLITLHIKAFAVTSRGFGSLATQRV